MIKGILTRILCKIFIWSGGILFPSISWTASENNDVVRCIIFALSERDRNIYARSYVEVLDDPVKYAKLTGRPAPPPLDL